jgi:DnaJ-class molecular chaperone
METPYSPEKYGLVICPECNGSGKLPKNPKGVNPSAPMPEGQGLPSSRAQAERLRVDPEPRFLARPLKTGPGAAERVKVCEKCGGFGFIKNEDAPVKK